MQEAFYTIHAEASYQQIICFLNALTLQMSLRFKSFHNQVHLSQLKTDSSSSMPASMLFNSTMAITPSVSYHVVNSHLQSSSHLFDSIPEWME